MNSETKRARFRFTIKPVHWLAPLIISNAISLFGSELPPRERHQDLTILLERERAAAEELHAIGAQIFVQGGHVTGVRIRDKRFSDQHANDLKVFTRLLSLEICESELTAIGLRAISLIQTLKKLKVASTRVKPRDYLILSSMTDLQAIEIGSLDDLVANRVNSDLRAELQHRMTGITRFEAMNITRKGLKHVGKMTWLREFHCVSPSFGDNDTQLLKGLTELRSLLISNIENSRLAEPLTGRSLRVFANAKSLESLEVLGVPLNAEDVKFISSFKQLKWLDLYLANIGDHALCHVKELEQLEYLRLSRTKVTAEGLKFLYHMPNLRGVEVPNQLSSKAALELQTELRARHATAEVRR